MTRPQKFSSEASKAGNTPTGKDPVMQKRLRLAARNDEKQNRSSPLISSRLSTAGSLS